MRLAIISITSEGAKLGNRLKTLLTDRMGITEPTIPMTGMDSTTIQRNLNRPLNEVWFDAVDVYSKHGRGCSLDQKYAKLADLVNRIFFQYDGFVFIMATGIVVRTIAPLIQDKRTDSAVVVMDEKGVHVISLLSGHLGRANYLTTLIAGRLMANPVITTASDVQGKIAPDVMAAECHLTIVPFQQLKSINTMLVEGKNISYFLDESLSSADIYADWLGRNGVSFRSLNEFPADADASIFITDKIVATDLVHLYLRPKTLVAGIGCRRGIEKASVLAALTEACAGIGRSIDSVGMIASVSIKADETGLLEAAAAIGAKTLFFEPALLERVVSEQGLAISEFVKSKIGVGSVCEAAAICGSKNNQLLLKKQAVYRGITIALAEVKSGS